MSFNNVIKAVFLLLITVQCSDFEFSKTLNVELGNQPDALVVNGIIKPNEPYSIAVSLTQSVLRDEFPRFLDNAKIFVSQNGTPYDTLVYKSLTFEANRFLRIGNTYQFNILVDSFDEVKADVTFPNKPKLSNMRVSQQTITENSDYQYDVLTANFTLQDNEGESFFLMQLTDELTGQTVVWESADAVFVQSGSGDISGDNTIQKVSVFNYIWFSDDLFAGKSRDISISIPLYQYDLFEFNVFDYQLYVYSISKELFEFLRRLKLQDESRFNPFAEPVEVFGNLENAYGVLAGISGSSLPIYYLYDSDGGNDDKN